MSSTASINPAAGSASWDQEIGELQQRRRWAEALGGPEAVARHVESGRLTIRGRIDGLLDAGSFQEVGKLTGSGVYRDGRVQSVLPAPYVMGLGRIRGRAVAVGGEDFTVRGGTSWGADRRKGGQGGFIEDFAANYRIPLVNLIDGAGGSVASIKKRGHAVFPGVHGFEKSVELMGLVPVVSCVMGVAAGGPAGRAILAHWSVMVSGQSQVFAAGPPVVQRAMGLAVTREELGGSAIAVDKAGTIDNAFSNEADALRAIGDFLSYLPQNVWEMPPCIPCDDPVERADEALATIIPRDRRKPYDMRRILRGVFDRQSLFEIQPTWGKGIITCFARLGGRPVGVIANNPMVYGGAMDARAARKQGHFVELCDTFHVPIVYLVDQPGFLVGPGAEAEGTLRDGMRAVYIGMQATVPALTLVVRKCYGMAGMAACDKAGINFKIAWPSAEIGNLPVQGGARAAFRREIEESPDPAAREAELEAELQALTSPFRMAEAFAVEDIIDPRETRAYLNRFVETAYSTLASRLGPKPRYGVRP
ncbi:carboxyl transferase domain-containing protein [Ramlibacter tataouinensis]|uniref:acyl-CoA carboxylase subunit beta n=1 Tax=Ramlibacter tataouinensis TaxID=94132 RepID=UPI0022F3B890|nr:carboxyl transferase domain-containing protein [Ramlibacter tataouinensis]WBY01057.1 carboxyl transferase domain-containing protein [Ramlibacter tataouinensis]